VAEQGSAATHGLAAPTAAHGWAPTRWPTGRALAVAAVLAVTLVGVGACAFDPQGERAGTDTARPVAAEQSTGASASPAPDQHTTSPPPAPTPSATSARPATSAKPTAQPASPKTAAPAGCPQGEHQRQVEAYLAQLGGFGTVTVDGVQSAADCAAIKKFQQRYGIRPAAGRAGPTTLDVARRLANTRTDQCQAGPGTTVCVNLTLQTVWVIRDGAVVMAPTVTRTGMRGFATPAGTFRIDRRNIKEWSDPYEVWLPYWQHFHRGMGFHETTTYLHDMSIGSHGCVNLLHADAVTVWKLATVGTRVHLFGRRPGT
jgi:hypothetical protein